MVKVCLQYGRRGFDSWVRSPREKNGNPLQHCCLDNPTDGEPGGLQSMGPQGVGHDRATSLLLELGAINEKVCAGCAPL